MCRAPRIGSRWGAAVASLLACAMATSVVHAAESSSVPVPSAPFGVAVLAVGEARPSAGTGATGDAGPNPPAFDLARAIYASRLRPASVDEPHARVLAGEAPPAGAPADLRDLAEMRSTVRGDDAPSRAVLDAIANAFHLKGIVVVDMLPAPNLPASNDPSSPTAPQARARVFLVGPHLFDAAQYAPGPGGDWATTVQSLQRTFLPAAAPLAAGPLGPIPETPTKKPFYTSPWFWGAAAAAVFAGAGIYVATRDNGPRTIHLQLQVTK
jgi:hypothetical protein